MKSYDGPGAITGGGSWVEMHHAGGEMWNFLPEAGRCYGYAMTRHAAGLDLARISPRPSARWSVNDEIPNVDIVFIARRPPIGQVVIGWFRNATIFHRVYRKRPDPAGGPAKLDYLCEVGADDTTLLSAEERTFKVPYAPADGIGPGQSNVWYADSGDFRTLRFISSLRRYIRSERGVPKSRAGGARRGGSHRWSKPLDKNTIAEIEKASMNATRNAFSARYILEDVCWDRRGWDITATAKSSGTELQLEVKGHLGDVIQFELTPNEFDRMQELKETYRVCVVRRALTQKIVEVYSPVQTRNGEWLLKNQKSGTIIKLSPRIAARASQIK